MLAIIVKQLHIVQSLAFWIGNSANITITAINAMITFSIYPVTLFDNTARLLLFTLIPAALMGAVPAAHTHAFIWQLLAELLAGAIIFLSLAIAIFHQGLSRYESGSGIQIEI